MKILIVDDELVSRKKMEKLIQSLGNETIIATDGLEAWEIWKKDRTRMVITDWLMPGMDGLDLCKKIRETEGDSYTYLIMVTSKRETGDIVIGMEAGADDFISKPFAKDELAVRIRAGERILSLETKDLVIFSLAKLAESRDSDTGNHLERIRFYSKVLAEALIDSDNSQLGIDQKFVDNIFLTSPLHDIGKTGIPDFILLKPARLDDKEFDLMKTHCQIGFDTLNEALKRYPKAEYLDMSAKIALYHHEKFNGSGYPHQLKEDNIPLAARIVALADVYDALMSKRVYKNAFSHNIAKSIILEESGKHFDPQVVDAFCKQEDTFIEIYNQFSEE